MSIKLGQLQKLLSLFLIVIFLLFSGCSLGKTDVIIKRPSEMKAEESSGVSFNVLGGKDVMPVSGYYGPYPINYSKNGNTMPDFISDKYYKLLSDAGINMISYTTTNYLSSPDLVYKSLELGEKYNIGMFVRDSTVSDIQNEKSLSLEEIASQINNYYNYPAFCGMYLVDEPQSVSYIPGDGTRDVMLYKKVADILQYDLGLYCYSNMLPITDMSKNREKYEKYVNEFCECFKPKILMWDYYPFDKYRNGDMVPYFYNMGLVREHAKKMKVPFWAYIQAGSQWNDSMSEFDSETPYWPNEAQFNWNINTCLAFGAQGIQFFPIIQPIWFAYSKTEKFDFQRNGILGAWGNKTNWYNYAQNISKQIKTIDEVLMNSVSKGVIVNGNQAKKDTSEAAGIIKQGKFRELQSVSGDVLVGCFNYQGKTAFYAVNYSVKYAQKITFNFYDTCKIDVIQNSNTSYKNSHNLTVDMAAAEGVLLIVN